MKDLIKIYEDKDVIHLSCEFIEGLNIRLQGRDKLFNFKVIGEFGNDLIIEKNIISEFDKLRVIYVKKINNKEKIIHYTNFVDVDLLKTKTRSDIKIKSVLSYKGISLSFQSEEIYDKYVLYEKEESGYKIIEEAEIFQITSSSLNIDKTYYVEAFNMKNDKYVLENTSKDFKIKFMSHKKERKNLLSIVIPVFNGEDFLPRTLDSVLLSTFQDFNVILVNDGSSDKTLDVFKWYKDKYRFISYIDKKWSGLSETRNKGIETANGDYLMLLDSDDLVHPNMYKLMVDKAVEEEADIVISKTIVIREDSTKEYILDYKNIDKFVKYDYIKTFEEFKKNSFENIYFVSPCNKIVSKKIYNSVKFPQSNYYEDNAYTPTLYSFANTFLLVDKAYYIWDKRKRATVGTYSTSYGEQSNVDLIDEYVKALSYSIVYGNQERNSYLLYQSTFYLKTYYDVIKKNPDTLRNFRLIIRKYFDVNNILNNNINNSDESFKEFLTYLA